MKKHAWLLVFMIAAAMCYWCFYLTKSPMWMIFGVLFLFTGGMQSIQVKNDENSKKGGYNQRNRNKAKEVAPKKKNY